MTDAAPIIQVFDQASATYDQVGVDFFGPIGAALVRAVAPRPGDRVLDVGCGRGAVLFPAAAAVGATGRVTGIDLAPGMVARTAEAARELPQAEVRLGDAQCPPFPDASFDVITAGLVLFFLPNPLGALIAYRGLLRPGGRLGLTSFAAHSPALGTAMRILAGFAVDPPPPLDQPPMFGSAASLSAAVTGAGFGDPVVGEFEVESQVRDADHLIAWIGSHTGRGVLSRIPPGRAPAAREALHRTFPGSLTLTTRIRTVVAAA